MCCCAWNVQAVADMIIHNRSAEVRRSRLASANRQSENIKLRLKLPYAQEGQLREVQELVKSIMEPPASSSSSSNNSTGVSPAATSSMDGMATSGEDESPRGSASTSASPVPGTARPAERRSSSSFGLNSLMKTRAVSRSAAAAAAAAAKITHPVVPGSVEVVISRFTDSGLELLVKAKLRVEPANSMVQALLLDLSRKVRQLGAVMVNV